MENVVAQLAGAQCHKGHRVRVVTLDRVYNTPDTGPLPKVERVDGVEIVRVPFFGSKRYPIAPSAIRHIRDADVVHVHGIDFFFDYLAWTAPLHRRRLIVSTHGGFFHTGFAARLKRLYFQTVTRVSLSRYAGVATVSSADDLLFRRIRTRGIRLIENGIDDSKYAGAGSPVPKKTMLALGRLSSNKRLDRTLDFLGALRRIDPAWSLIIAGRPYDVSVADLRARADAMGLSEHVTIADTPTEEGIRDLMHECSVFVSASAYEGFGLVAVEALSAGLWPVLSSIPAFRHLAERTRLGSVIDFDDMDEAVRQFLADWTAIAAGYDRCRASAMAAAAHFRWPAANARYEALYESVTGNAVRSILDVPILAQTTAGAIDLLERRYDDGAPGAVVFANAHTLNNTVADACVRAMLDRSIVFNDGIGVDIASRLLFGQTFPENLNGTDFVPEYLKRTRHRHRIFLLGGRPGIAEKAAARLAMLAPQHAIAGCCHGYMPDSETNEVVATIRRSGADILLVAMGNPQQEAWLDAHLKDTGCKLGFGVGGLFDFLAEVVPRAPRWVQSARIEWAFRLAQEPGRLWRRYLVQMPIFLLRVGRQWAGGARVSAAPSTQ